MTLWPSLVAAQPVEFGNRRFVARVGEADCVAVALGDAHALAKPTSLAPCREGRAITRITSRVEPNSLPLQRATGGIGKDDDVESVAAHRRRLAAPSTFLVRRNNQTHGEGT